MAFLEKIKIGRIVDGDTVILDDTRRIRLFGIDAPETYPKEQKYGQIATDFLHLLLRGNVNKEILMQSKGEDKYGRTIGIIYIVDSDGNKNDIGIIMLQAGLAWAYNKYLEKESEEKDYLKAEKEAKTTKRHIWSDPNSINPSQFRRMIKNK